MRKDFGVYRRSRRSGLTLVELVMAIAITAIIGAGAVYTIAGSAAVYKSASEETALAFETWTAIERIARELRAAAASPAPSPAPGETAPALSFTRPPAAQGECPECVDNSTQVTFTWSPEDNTLWRETAASGKRMLADNVTAFSVSAEGETQEKIVYVISITRAAGVGDRARAVTMETAVHPPALEGDEWVEAVR